MADPMIEIIPGAPSTEADGTSNQETQESQSPTELSRRTVDELDSALPEKFRGKSVYDLSESYQQLEKEKGRIASELGQARKAAEEAAAKSSLLERQLQDAANARLQQPTTPQQREVTDPLADFDQRFDKDPKEAVRYASQAAINEARNAQFQADQRMQQSLATQRYEQLKKDKSDFSEHEAEMVNLASKFGAYLRPEVANRPEIVDLMYDLARGRNTEKLISKAIENSKKAGELVRDEKRSAFSESSNSNGSSEKDFAELSLAEMEKRLGRSD